MVIENFKQAYAIARNNRHHRLWANEFIRFPGGYVFIGDTGGLNISRDGRPLGPGYFHTVGQNRCGVRYRRVRVQNSREAGPVPLP